MTGPDPIRDTALARLKWPVRLTRAGMASERIVRGFWPVWTILFLLIAGLGFGLQDALPVEAVWIGALLALGGTIAFAVRGWRRFRLPTEAEALDRLDARLAGRPIAALTDTQAVGGRDAQSAAVWQAHLNRMADRSRAARAEAPDLRIAGRDPFALRYVAATAFLLALLFGSLWRVADVANIAAGGTPAVAAAGPAWEAWVEPPAYTGKPSLYLNEIAAETLTVPEGSRLTVRLYAEPGSVAVDQSLGDPPVPPAVAEGQTAPAAAPANLVEVEIVRSGRLAISGDQGRGWDVTVTPDAPPTVTFAGEIGRDADGALTQPFTAKDDYAIVAGKAIVTLDVAKLDRRFGLAAEPEPREDIVYDLPMPITGSRAEFTESLVEDASKHPWANMPVKIALSVEDGRVQTGESEMREVVLPGRRFFDPLANAIIEMRRDLLWTRENGPRVLQILRAFTHRPEGFITNERAYLMLRVAMRRLDGGLSQGPLAPSLRDEIADAFWEVALLLEDGGLSDALERMQQAQERLAEAMRRGASPEEIQRLMDELREATDDYMRQLAENMERQGADEPSRQAEMQGQMLTGDQIQQMMDEIQRLMEEGRMAEAQELLEQLNQLMQNLRMVEGQGQGQQGPGGQAMRDLQDTLREQQDLSDDTFGDLQRQFGQNGQQGQQPGQPGGQQPGGQQPGQPGGQQPGQPGEQPGQPGGQQPGQEPGQDGPGGEEPGEEEGQGSLADRQQALRDQLNGQMPGEFPGANTPEGEAARRAIEEAGRAMNDAERALRDGDRSTALDRQAEAIENLREGLRSLGEALAQNDPNQQPQQGQQGEATAEGQRPVPRDPLGRESGSNGQMTSNDEMLGAEDVYRRARDLLEEIRRRSGDQTRPSEELDYLRRLLNQF